MAAGVSLAATILCVCLCCLCCAGFGAGGSGKGRYRGVHSGDQHDDDDEGSEGEAMSDGHYEAQSTRASLPPPRRTSQEYVTL